MSLVFSPPTAVDLEAEYGIPLSAALEQRSSVIDPGPVDLMGMPSEPVGMPDLFGMPGAPVGLPSDEAQPGEDEYAVPNIVKKRADRAAPSATAGPSDEYADMKRLQLIKILRKRNVDYNGRDVEELRKLARESDAGSSSPPSSPPVKKDSKKRSSSRKSKAEKEEEARLATLTPFQRELAVEGVSWFVTPPLRTL